MASPVTTALIGSASSSANPRGRIDIDAPMADGGSAISCSVPGRIRTSVSFDPCDAIAHSVPKSHEFSCVLTARRRRSLAAAICARTNLNQLREPPAIPAIDPPGCPHPREYPRSGPAKPPSVGPLHPYASRFAIASSHASTEQRTRSTPELLPLYLRPSSSISTSILIGKASPATDVPDWTL